MVRQLVLVLIDLSSINQEKQLMKPSFWIENTGFNIRLHQGNKPLQYAQFNYQMSKRNDESTLVQLAMILEVPWGLIGRIFNRLIF